MIGMRTRFGITAASIVVGGLMLPDAWGQPLNGTIEQRSFLGPLTNRMVAFNIYLPEGYATSSARYPVIYHLHGIGGSQGGPQNATVPGAFEAALAQGVIGPVIIVFPSCYVDGWWADSFDGLKPAETDVALQIVPYVDATFRTIPTRGARVVEGFSMGGFGATKFFAKFPELFSVCIEYDGAIVTWPIVQQFHAAQAASIFGNSEAYFDQFSPWHWTSEHAATLRDGHAVRMVVGALLGGNRSFRDHLLALQIPVEYVETGCGHELGCLFNAQGLVSAGFIAARLDLPCGAAACGPADLNCDGAVDFFDVDPFLLALFDAAGYAVAYPECDVRLADLNGDGTVSFFDIDPFVACVFAACP